MSDQAVQQESVYQRAEAGARVWVLTIGGGVLAFFAGGILMSGLSVIMAERFGAIHSPAAGFVVGWLYQRLWLWLALPGFAWLVARFRPVRPLAFAVGSALSGELFDILLSMARSGFDAVFLDALDVAARVITFALGVWVVHRAIEGGQADAAQAQAEADAVAVAQRAEYAEFLARAEQGPAVSSPPPPAEPPSSSAS